MQAKPLFTETATTPSNATDDRNNKGLKTFSARIMRGFDKRSTYYGRFGYTNILDLERGEPNSDKSIKIVFLKDGSPITAFLPTKELTQQEVMAVHAFINRGRSDTLESVTDEALESYAFQKPKNGTSKPKLSGLDYLEERLKPKEGGITEAVSTTTITAAQSRFKPVTVRKTYTLTVTEEYVLPMTDKTLSEFKRMRDGDEKARITYQYLLERHTEEKKPDGTRTESTGDPHFEIMV